MTLGQHQEAFARDLVKLLNFCHVRGLEVRMGELWRPQEMQDIYFKTGRSKTRVSQHSKKLAVDLNIVIAGKLATREQMLPVGRYWESLNPLNRWGGSWRGLVEAGKSSFVDAPHFERNA
jgi:hypothetical protein